jgi:hypothetical protein
VLLTHRGRALLLRTFALCYFALLLMAAGQPRINYPPDGSRTAQPQLSGLNFASATTNGFCLVLASNSAVVTCGAAGDTNVTAASTTGILIPPTSSRAVLRSLRCRVVTNPTGIGVGDSFLISPYWRNGVANGSIGPVGLTIPDSALVNTEIEQEIGWVLPGAGGFLSLRVTESDGNDSVTDLDLTCVPVIAY